VIHFPNLKHHMVRASVRREGGGSYLLWWGGVDVPGDGGSLGQQAAEQALLHVAHRVLGPKLHLHQRELLNFLSSMRVAQLAAPYMLPR